MKKYKFFAVGIAMLSVFSLASCQKDKDVVDDKEVIEGIPTIATFTLNQNGPKTYAGETEEASTSEKDIKNATVYVFSARKLTNIIKFDANAASKTTSLTSGLKQFFACVNMNERLATLTEIQVGMTLDAFKKQLLVSMESTEEGQGLGVAAAAGKFWMTNVGNDATEVTVLPDVIVPSAGPEGNTFEIGVGRVVSKLTVKVDNNLVQVSGKLTTISYRIHNIPKQSYLMPVFANVDYSGNRLVTPYSAKAWNQTGSPGDYFTNPVPGQTTPIADASYMLENADDHLSSGKLTYVLIKGTWTPDNAIGGVLTQGDFWLVANLDGPANNENSKVVNYINQAYNSEAGAQAQCTANQKPVKFAKGICYYRILLEDMTTKPDVAVADPVVKYTINRNHVFNVNISKISGPGSQTPGEVVPDPDQPVEKESQMTATVKVLPWTVVNQDAQI